MNMTPKLAKCRQGTWLPPLTGPLVSAVVLFDVSIVFNEVCAVVVFPKSSVQVLGFVGQTVVGATNNLRS